MINRVVLTVHQLNDYVRVLLARDPLLQKVSVRGEISNFKHHSSGHMYFSLKDEQARIQCVWFKQKRTGAVFPVKDGMQMIATGNVSLYTRDGQYQLYVEDMEHDGQGDLHLKFEELKKKLREEGLFNDEYKKPLPLLPKKIAVITSHTGAAVRDIIRVITQRNPYVSLLVIPVAVQGQNAAEQIARAIEYANTRNDLDLIITGRGGGSIEELWAFNEEITARTIFRSHLPVISAVGHETDFTIADFVADVRASTPSNAGELAVPESINLLSMVKGMQKSLLNAMDFNINRKHHSLELLVNHYVFQTPRLLVDQHSQYLDLLIQRMNYAVESHYKHAREHMSQLVSTLQALSPLNVLARGYAIPFNEGFTKPIRSIHQLTPKQRIRLLLQDGQAVCTVDEADDASHYAEDNIRRKSYGK
ncbi:MAG TPA: exodeoxyribonuclease VII large subunit [Clostridiales bacterium]|nr:exodeoxyribonuclease VII large subunit [Clostridiales bacterium]